MDKTLMNLANCMNPTYINGVNSFLDYAFTKSARGNSIRCPCYKCVNSFFHTRDVVFTHLMLHGIVKAYKWWSCHGEERVSEIDESDEASQEDENSSNDDMHGLLGDLKMGYRMNEADAGLEDEKEVKEKGEDTTEQAYTLVLGHRSGYIRGCKHVGSWPLCFSASDSSE